MHRAPHPNELFDALRADGPGTAADKRAALGRAITLAESGRPTDRAAARALVERCLPLSGDALRLGVTGIPGAGKSTLIDTLGEHLIAAGHRVAVLAVDPSSARSGGSILGDKTRMERLSRSDAAFVRPTPTGGMLGGVARRTREAIVLCEAAGYDRVLVETVGTGQSELEVDHMTDLTLLLAIAGAGDELQGIKRGIMESADLIALTKADGEGLARAEGARRDLLNAIALLPARDSGRHPEVLTVSALEGRGIGELAQRIEALFAEDRASGRTKDRRRGQDLFWLRHALREGLLERFAEDPGVAAAMPTAERAVREGLKSPFQAAEELLGLFRKDAGPLP